MPHFPREKAFHRGEIDFYPLSKAHFREEMTNIWGTLLLLTGEGHLP